MTNASPPTLEQQLADLQSKLRSSKMAGRGMLKRIQAIEAAIALVEVAIQNKDTDDGTTEPSGTDQ